MPKTAEKLEKKSRLLPFAILCGAILTLKFLRRRGEKKRGYYEKLGEKVDHGLGNLASKAQDLMKR